MYVKDWISWQTPQFLIDFLSAFLSFFLLL